MTGVFDDFIPVLPEFMKGLDEIKKQSPSFDDAIQQISELIYSKSSLYVLVAWIIRGENLIAISSFSKDSNQLMVFKERYSKKAIALNPPQSVTDYVLSSKNPRFWTDEKRYDKTFWGPIFNLTSSEIYLPLKKSGEVIGVLQMGSDDMVEFSTAVNVNDDIVMQSNWQTLQLLSEKINEILTSTEH